MHNTSKTLIKGKDLDLETTIATMLGKLRNIGVEIEEVSWLNPVPDVYSVHIRDRDCHANFTNGKGTSRKACLASALGEFCERFSNNFFFADYYLGRNVGDKPYAHYPNERWVTASDDTWRDSILTERLWKFFDPEGELQSSHLADNNTDHKTGDICVLPYERLGDGETVWFPINIIANLYVSNGMAAGNTMPEARVEGLSEILERYVKNKVIAEGICLPLLPSEVIDRFPKIRGMIIELQQHGYHLRVADASLGGVYPVLSVTLINPESGAVFASFGAHPCFEIALERTVVELLQGRSLKQLEGFQPPTFDMQSVAEPYNLEDHFINSSGLLGYDFFRCKADFPFVDWNMDADTTTEHDYLCDLIHSTGHEIYVANFDCPGVYACRILVPGMSEIYDVGDLVWNNKNEGARFRCEILDMNTGTPQRWRALLDNLDYGGYSDVTSVMAFIGILPDADTVWAGLCIGELKAMLCLALGDHKASLQWVDWCLNMGHLAQDRNKHYRCMQAILHISLEREEDFADFTPSLGLMYGEDTVAIAMRVFQQKEVFLGLDFPGLDLAGFQAHGGLLKAYAKLHSY